MTAVGYVVREVVLKIDGTAYECAVVGCVLTPSVNLVEWDVACPDGHASDMGTTAWTLDLDYMFDPAAASLSTVLADNAGDAVAFEFTPDPIGNPTRKRTGTVRLIPGPEGGTVNSPAQQSVSLPVIGAPAWGA
jgi:hypothetical protein